MTHAVTYAYQPLKIHVSLFRVRAKPVQCVFDKMKRNPVSASWTERCPQCQAVCRVLAGSIKSQSQCVHFGIGYYCLIATCLPEIINHMNAVKQHFERQRQRQRQLFVCLCWCNAQMPLSSSKLQHPFLPACVAVLLVWLWHGDSVWVRAAGEAECTRRVHGDGVLVRSDRGAELKTLSFTDIALLAQHVQSGSSTHAHFYVGSLCSVQ